MALRRIIIDTNVLVSALRSKRGASFRLVQLIGSGRFEVYVSVPLVLEYEDALKRHRRESGFSVADIERLVDVIIGLSHHQEVYYRWRGHVRDPKDAHVLEVAVAAGCRFIVTYNTRDFHEAEHFGIEVVTAREFLSILQ